MPVGVGMYRIVHHDGVVTVTELPSIGVQSSDPNKSTSFYFGVFFALKIEKTPIFCFYTLVDGKPTLLTAKVVNSDGK